MKNSQEFLQLQGGRFEPIVKSDTQKSPWKEHVFFHTSIFGNHVKFPWCTHLFFLMATSSSDAAARCIRHNRREFKAKTRDNLVSQRVFGGHDILETFANSSSETLFASVTGWGPHPNDILISGNSFIKNLWPFIFVPRWEGDR